MGVLQPGHLILILLIALIILGPGKLAGLGEQLGRGVREFRQSVDGQDDPKAIATGTRYCTQCGTAARADSKFCTQCGRPLDGAA